jgi:predicted alpha/beta hydrolase
MDSVQLASFLLPLPSGEQLSLRRFYVVPKGPAVFLLHGSVENGRIFHDRHGQKGWAAFLARSGYDVYVGDLRGRGESHPPVSRTVRAGNEAAITEDLPAFLHHIQHLRGSLPSYWGAHSWGGVQLLAHLARFPNHGPRAMVFFGAVRRKRIRNWRRILLVNGFYGWVGSGLCRLYGYLPARRLGLGSDNETAATQRLTHRWLSRDAWRSPVDGLDYQQALEGMDLPPTLYLSGGADTFLAHPTDVRRGAADIGHQRAEHWTLSRAGGFARDYGHNDMLTHPAAVHDHFPRILQWMNQQNPS